MTVSIDIDLDALGAKQEIGQLKLMLESLDDDLNIDFDLDGDIGDTIDKLSEAMDDLSESFNSDLNETIDRLESLEFDDISVKRGYGNSGGDTGSDSGDRHVPSARQYFSGGPLNDDDGGQPLQRSLQKFHRNIESISDFNGVASRLNDFERTDRFSRINSDVPNWTGDYDFDSSFEDRIDSSIFDSFDRSEEEIKSRMGYSPTESMSRIRGTSDMDLLSWDADQPSPLSDELRKVWGEPENTDPFNFGADIGLPGKNKNGKGSLSNLPKKFKNIRTVVDGLSNSVKRLIPSMSTWINLVGMAVPALGALAVQALGVASAMGAIALAGGAMIGLGLLGHGDTMAESMRNAKQQISNLKQNLFEEFEPVADMFAPIQEEFFNFIPTQMDGITGSLEGLRVFKDDIFSLFRGGTQFISEFIDVITENESIISDLTKTFSKLIGQSILDFFEWLLQSTSENKQMLIELGGILKTVASAIYNVFMMVSRAIIMLRPFFSILSWIGKLMNNSLISGMVAVVAVMYVVASAIGGIISSMTVLASVLGTGLIPLFSSMFTYLSTYIFQTLAATMANYGLAASIANVAAALGTLLAMTGVGLLLAGGGLALGKMMGIGDVPGGKGASSSIGNWSGGSGGGKTVVNEGDTVNVDIGDSDTASIEKFADMRGSGGDRGPIGGSYTSD